MSSKYTVYQQRIIDIRTSGKSVKQTSEELGIPTYVVERCMARNGLSHTVRAKGYRQQRSTIEDAVKLMGSVFIEQGSAGGYIATVGEKHTGTVEETAVKAVRSAIKAASCSTR